MLGSMDMKKDLVFLQSLFKIGSGRGDRTPDTWIMIPPLYHLSYSAIVDKHLIALKKTIVNKKNKKILLFYKKCYNMLKNKRY